MPFAGIRPQASPRTSRASLEASPSVPYRSELIAATATGTSESPEVAGDCPNAWESCSRWLRAQARGAFSVAPPWKFGRERGGDGGGGAAALSSPGAMDEGQRGTVAHPTRLAAHGTMAQGGYEPTIGRRQHIANRSCIWRSRGRHPCPRALILHRAGRAIDAFMSARVNLREVLVGATGNAHRREVSAEHGREADSPRATRRVEPAGPSLRCSTRVPRPTRRRTLWPGRDLMWCRRWSWRGGVLVAVRARATLSACASTPPSG